MNLRELVRKHFFTGLLVIAPILVVSWILLKILGLLWGIQAILPEAWRPDNFLSDPTLAFLLNSIFTLAAAFLVASGISILGWASNQYMGKKALEMLADFIQRIPVLRSIYSALEQLMRAMAPGGGGQQFKRVVYIEWPRKGIWAIAFVTSVAKGANLPPGFLNVFIPATPNPTSGFHLIISESEVREAEMTVEEAFKTILSLGIAQPSRSFSHER